jgi:hypothetical protein
MRGRYKYDKYSRVEICIRQFKQDIIPFDHNFSLHTFTIINLAAPIAPFYSLYLQTQYNLHTSISADINGLSGIVDNFNVTL